MAPIRAPSGAETTIATQTLTLTGAYLQTAIDAKTITFWFAEETAGADKFRLHSVQAKIAAVPVPAAGLLLMGGLGGLALLRRRKAVA